VFVVGVALVVTTVFSPTAVAAGARGKMMQPLPQIMMPVEVAGLSTHLNLNLMYTNFELFGPRVNVVQLGIEGQVAILDRLELGVMIPVLVHGWINGSGGDAETEFGNLILNLKLKLVGASRGPFALSMYFNTTLPTTSADLGTREYAGIQGGVAAAGKLGVVTFGANTGPWSFIAEGEGLVIYQIDFFVGAMPLNWLGLQLALQLGIPVHNAGDQTAFAMTPAAQFWPAGGFHIDIGTRIAISDFGRFYTNFARATFNLAIGYDW
jgi:hypothetical protein